MDKTSIERVDEMQATAPGLVGPDEGEFVHLLALGVRFMIDGEQTSCASPAASPTPSGTPGTSPPDCSS
jgi:hypothetical protein